MSHHAFQQNLSGCGRTPRGNVPNWGQRRYEWRTLFRSLLRPVRGWEYGVAVKRTHGGSAIPAAQVLVCMSLANVALAFSPGERGAGLAEICRRDVAVIALADTLKVATEMFPPVVLRGLSDATLAPGMRRLPRILSFGFVSSSPCLVTYAFLPAGITLLGCYPCSTREMSCWTHAPGRGSWRRPASWRYLQGLRR